MTTLRRTGATSAAVLSGLIAMFGLAHAATPEWARQAGLDVWNLGEAQERLRETNEESARLRDEVEQLRESIEAAEHLTTRLINGEVTLAHATDLIEPLMLERPGFKSSASISHPAPTFRLMVARYLVDHVRRSLQSDPSRLAGLEVQLRAEFESMK
jgi:hypothetical protein